MLAAASLRPTRLVQRGVVAATAVVLDARWLSERELRRRVLQLWQPGTTVIRSGDDCIVRFAQPRWMTCERALGLVAVESHGAFLGLPLRARELDRQTSPGGMLLRLRAGALEAIPLAGAPIEDPAAWLGVDSFEVLDARSLGRPAAAPRVTVPEAVPFDARDRFAGIPPSAPAREELLRKLENAEPASSTAPRWLATKLGGLLGRIAGRPWFGRRAAVGRRVGAPAPAAEPRQLPRPIAWLVSRLMLIGRFGQRDARYLDRLMGMLERGDVDEALRHAIPIGGPVAQRLRSLFASPFARQSLSIQPNAAPAGFSIGVADGLLAELERLYRDAFHRLVGQGRIDEAAFVLAELLHANQEAVAFLERHGRLKLAAEIAEARQLPPELVVRQWFVAGERERAVEIARKTRAFAAAVRLLERGNRRDEAHALRVLWADSLASEGDFVGAVETIWKVPQARHLGAAWIDRGIELGGSTGAAMLVKKLALDPGSFEAMRDIAVALLDDDRVDGVPARRALAAALSRAPQTPELTTLARPALRAILRDAALYATPPGRDRIDKLVAFAKDGALRADQPALPTANHVPLSSIDPPVRIAIEAADVGTMALYDAAFLENGKLLVALGEAGASLRSREGSEIARFDVPAHRLVVSDAGDRAIAIAPRGEVSRLSRLDLVRRTANDWCDAPLEAFASDYDGARWFVGGRDLFAIDVTGAGFDGRWRVADISDDGSSTGLRIARSPARCAVLVPGSQPQVWSYQLPSLTLRSRSDVELGQIGATAITHGGLVVEHAPAAVEGLVARPSLVRWRHPGGRLGELDLGTACEQPGPLAATETFIAAACRDGEAVRVELIDVAQGRMRAGLTLPRASTVSLRIKHRTLTIADDKGRLLVMDLDQGWLIRDLRL